MSNSIQIVKGFLLGALALIALTARLSIQGPMMTADVAMPYDAVKCLAAWTPILAPREAPGHNIAHFSRSGCAVRLAYGLLPSLAPLHFGELSQRAKDAFRYLLFANFGEISSSLSI